MCILYIDIPSRIYVNIFNYKLQTTFMIFELFLLFYISKLVFILMTNYSFTQYITADIVIPRYSTKTSGYTQMNIYKKKTYT